MKTKQEQIEEMAKERNEIKDIMKLLDKCVSLNPMCKSEVASVLYGNNYRKIPENAVVLTKEDYDKLGLFEETVQEYKSDNGQLVLVKERKTLQKYSTDIADFIRKETAKEILQCLYDECYEIQNMGRGGIAHILPIDILQLAKHYRVEVEE